MFEWDESDKTVMYVESDNDMMDIDIVLYPSCENQMKDAMSTVLA